MKFTGTLTGKEAVAVVHEAMGHVGPNLTIPYLDSLDEEALTKLAFAVDSTLKGLSTLTRILQIAVAARASGIPLTEVAP